MTYDPPIDDAPWWTRSKETMEAHAEGYAQGRADEREACADFLAAKSAKIAEDAKTIELGARSARRTFLSGCPAWDVEQYVAGVVAEDAAAIRARAAQEGASDV